MEDKNGWIYTVAVEVIGTGVEDIRHTAVGEG